jgi:hypothetical protein
LQHPRPTIEPVETASVVGGQPPDLARHQALITSSMSVHAASTVNLVEYEITIAGTTS